MFSIAKDVQVADSILKVGIVTPSDYDIQRAMPRPCAPWSLTLMLFVIGLRILATKVNLHGARPWHPQNRFWRVL